LFPALTSFKLLDNKANFGDLDMSAQNPQLQSRQELESKLIAKAWQDETFKQELFSNPKAAFAKEMGQPLPENVEIRVLEETPTTFYIVVPKNPEVSEELSDEALEAVAGGGSNVILAKGYYVKKAG
jgi:Nitrile hydratase, alpha chain